MDRLQDSQGFSLDTRAPRWDFHAVQLCNKHFGKTVVRHVLEKFKRSHVTLDALKEDVMEYDVDYNPRLIDDPVYISVVQSVRKEFVPQVPIVPLTIGAVTTLSSTPKDKSPGLPWREMGFKTKQEVMESEDAMREIRKDWILIGKGYRRTLPDSMCFARAQICTKDKNKVRATWGYPTGVFLEEARFVYPYLDFLKNRRDDYPLAYGVEIGNGGMGYIDDMFTRSGSSSVAVMMDWKRFDKTIPPWLIRDAFSILQEAFVFDRVLDSEGKVWPVNDQISIRRWKKVIDYFINTPLLMPSGERYRKSGGVPSGSCWTNVIDSIINAIVTRYCMYHVTGSLPLYDIYMGDDSFLMSARPVDLETIAKFALSRFGMVLNTDKSYTTTNRMNLQFLGYFNDNGYPIRSQDFLLASFMLPERVQMYPDPYLTAARAVGQMWSTFNGRAALRWHEIVADIERNRNFPSGWFTAYMKNNPNKLKFLRLHGLDATTFPDPAPFSDLNAPMQPPPHPNRRRPVRRVTDIQDLYYQFIDDPMRECEDTDPPDQPWDESEVIDDLTT